MALTLLSFMIFSACELGDSLDSIHGVCPCDHEAAITPVSVTIANHASLMLEANSL